MSVITVCAVGDAVMPCVRHKLLFLAVLLKRHNILMSMTWYCHGMLCLFCAVLCCAVLCCAVLCCAGCIAK